MGESFIALPPDSHGKKTRTNTSTINSEEVHHEVVILADNNLNLINNQNPYPVQILDPLSAFGDTRTVELSPVFQGSFEYTVDNTEITTNTVVNGGTVTQNNAMAVIGTSTTTSSTALLVSKQHARYRSGFGGLLRFTALYTSPVAGTEQYHGIMDEVGSSAAFKNGYGIGYDGTTFGIHRWQNDVKTSIAQADWDDPLDGTGVSKMTLDQTKINVWAISFQYLGAGAIRIMVEDDITGRFIVVHTILYANLNTVPSVFNPNFHYSMWVNNGSTTSDIIIKGASFAYFIEGFTLLRELHQPQQSSGTVEKTSVTTEVAIFTIRNKSTYQSKTNFIDIVPELLTASIEASSANNLGKIRLLLNTSLGGTPSFSDINTSDSVIDIDTAGTTTSTAKELLSINLAGKNDRIFIDLTPYKFLISPGETLTITGTSANSATIDASLLWKELF